MTGCCSPFLDEAADVHIIFIGVFYCPHFFIAMPQVSPAFPFRPLFTLSPVRSPHSPILSQSKQGPLIKRMPYKSLCIQIRSRAWLGRRPWRQRVGLAFLMLHTRLSSASLLACHVSLGPCTGSQCQDTALVPFTVSNYQRDRLDTTHLGPQTLGYAEQRPKLLTLQERKSCHLRIPCRTPWCALVGEVGEQSLPQNAGGLCSPRDVVSRPLGQELSCIQRFLLLC